MAASCHGHDKCVKLLLDKCAQANHQDKVSAFPYRDWSVICE